MSRYSVNLSKKVGVAEGTMAFFFNKPGALVYRSGQSFDWTILNPTETDNEGNTRTFSAITAPNDNQIGFATRLRDTAFKRYLRSMPDGTAMDFEGPYGSMILHKDTTKSAVFLAGGIGITPFRSIIRDATQNSLPHKIFLFYSNRRPEDTAFLTELTDYQTQNPNFKAILTMTDMTNSKQPWNGETGYINEELVKKNLPQLDQAIFYTAGPPAMVTAMKELLQKMGVNEDNVRSEDFVGY